MTSKRDNAGIYGPGAGQRPVGNPPQPQVQPGGTPVRPAEEPNVYLKTKVLTASPAELRLMLIDGAIRFAEQAQEGLRKQDHEQSFEGFSKARAIVTELISGLDASIAPELCDRLSGLYTFIFTRLVDAASERSPEILDEVLELFRFERETWAMLVENLARENASAASMSEAPDATPVNEQGQQPPNGTLPTAGRISATG